MTVIMTEELSAEVDDFLAHYGVKGMRWGHRKAEDGSSGGSAKPEKKKYTKDEILSARARTASRVHEINNQIAKTNLATGKQLDKEVGKLAKMQMDYLNNPDRATALRMTKGEKWGLAVLGLASNLVAPGVGTVAVAGVAGHRVASRRAAEKDIANRTAKTVPGKKR